MGRFRVANLFLTLDKLQLARVKGVLISTFRDQGGVEAHTLFIEFNTMVES
jgi:hypothetical protein